MAKVSQWSADDIALMRQGFINGERIKVLARRLNRTPTALNKALTRFGIRGRRFLKNSCTSWDQSDDCQEQFRQDRGNSCGNKAEDGEKKEYEAFAYLDSYQDKNNSDKKNNQACRKTIGDCEFLLKAKGFRSNKSKKSSKTKEIETKIASELNKIIKRRQIVDPRNMSRWTSMTTVIDFLQKRGHSVVLKNPHHNLQNENYSHLESQALDSQSLDSQVLDCQGLNYQSFSPESTGSKNVSKQTDPKLSNEGITTINVNSAINNNAQENLSPKAEPKAIQNFWVDAQFVLDGDNLNSLQLLMFANQLRVASNKGIFLVPDVTW